MRDDGLPTGRISERQVEVFRAVMLGKTLSAAASQLFVSQPALTVTLKRFEQQLGCKLFERIGGRLVPTDEARRILVEVEKVFGQFGRMADAIHAIARGHGGVFRFGASPSALVDVIPRALHEFDTKLRAVGRVAPHLQCDSLAEAEIRDYLWFGRGACVVSIASILDPELRVTRISTAKLVVLMPRSHRLAGSRALQLMDLAHERVIAFEPETAHGRLIQRQPGADKLDVAVRVRVVHIAINMVRTGLGIAVLDGFSAMAAASMGLAVVPLAQSVDVPLSVYRSRSHPAAPDIDTFIACLRKCSKPVAEGSSSALQTQR